MRNVMHAITAESYPATHFLKDYVLDFQVRKAMTWEDFMTGEKVSNIDELRQILVKKIEPNEFDPEARHLRRGENIIHGMISTKKRRKNLEPMSYSKSLRAVSVRESTINEQLSAEDHNESSEDESPAFNPTSPPSTVETTESYATSPPSTVRTTESSYERTQGPRTTLEHRNSHRSGTRNPPWKKITQEIQICPCSRYQ